jgi:hypothetical protein
MIASGTLRAKHERYAGDVVLWPSEIRISATKAIMAMQITTTC